MKQRPDQLRLMTKTDNVTYRDANRKDLKELNALIRVSKGYWGYSDDFMNKFMELFQLTEDYITHQTVKVMLKDNKIVGLCGFKLHDDQSLELDYFFILPDYIGTGLGKKLWGFTCEVAKKLTDDSFILWSDPEAEEFYKKMGCKRIGMKKSPVIENREAPMMQYFFRKDS
jgi:streptomycin 6-kinase